MTGLFQFLSEALIAAINSQRATEEKPCSTYVSSQTCTLFDKPLTAAKRRMMVITRHALLPLRFLLLSRTCTEISDARQRRLFLRKTCEEVKCACVCICLLCAWDCEHDSLQGFDQTLCCRTVGRRDSLWWPKGGKKVQSQQKSRSSSWKVKVHGHYILLCFSTGECNSRSFYGWLVPCTHKE